MPEELFVPDFGDRAKAIGNLLLNWRGLEEDIDRFIQHLSGDGVAQMQLVCGIIRTRPKIEILKTFGFIVLSFADPDAFPILQTLLKEIDNEFTSFRNRIVHDAHVFDLSGEGYTESRKPKFNGDGGPLTLTVGERTETSNADINTMSARVLELRNRLAALLARAAQAIQRTGRKPFAGISG